MYISQKSNLLPGDWYNMVAEDFNKIDPHIIDDLLAQTNKEDYKKLIRCKVHETAFGESLKSLTKYIQWSPEASTLFIEHKNQLQANLYYIFIKK